MCLASPLSLCRLASTSTTGRCRLISPRGRSASTSTPFGHTLSEHEVAPPVILLSLSLALSFFSLSLSPSSLSLTHTHSLFLNSLSPSLPPSLPSLPCGMGTRWVTATGLRRSGTVSSRVCVVAWASAAVRLTARVLLYRRSSTARAPGAVGVSVALFQLHSFRCV